MHPVEFTWYKAVVLITAAMAIGFGILNVYYFNKIRLNNVCKQISSSEANAGLWLNIILVIFSGILFFWSLFRLIFPTGLTKQFFNKTYNTHIHSPENYSAVPMEIPSSPSGAASPTGAPPLIYTSSSPEANIISSNTESMIAKSQEYL
jgi:NADH:ubiquinone oxidoreductase subunit 5 (subunit L)/multisubunit Na+/H+ antiporter MnhA subunit